MESNETKGRLREHFRLMEPDELAPEERWERVVELLAMMCLAPEAEVPEGSRGGPFRAQGLSEMNPNPTSTAESTFVDVAPTLRALALFAESDV